MGKVPQPETKRNKELAEDYLLKNDSGDWKYTISQLGLKYAREDIEGNKIPLTSSRIYQILSKQGVEKNRVSPKE
jgi:hypothetical protein